MAHNEESGLGKFDTHKTFWRQEGQRKTTHNIFKEFEQIDGGTTFRRNKRKTEFIKSYKAEEFVEVHDGLLPDGTRYINKTERTNLKIKIKKIKWKVQIFLFVVKIQI